MDNPISLRRQLELPFPNSADFGYAGENVYNKTYSDEVPEANSESDNSTAPHSGTTSEDDDDMAKFRAGVQSANLIIPSGYINYKISYKTINELLNIKDVLTNL